MPESTQAALEYLDRQRHAAIPIRDHLLSVVKDLQEGVKAYAEFITSEEGKLQFEQAWLLQSPLVVLLRDIATRVNGPGDWIPLETAGRQLRQYAPDEVAKLLERYGHRTLKGLLEATGCFDVWDEPTAKGGSRTVYRLKPQLNLASSAENS